MNNVCQVQAAPTREVKKEVRTGGLLAGLLAAAAIAGVAAPDTAMAGGAMAFDSQSNEAIASTEKILARAGFPDMTISASRSLNLSHTRLMKNGKTIAEIGEDFEEVLPRLTPDRVAFEVSAAENFRKPTLESIRGTSILVTGYAKNLMDRMGLIYLDGNISGNFGKIPLANRDSTRPGTVVNIEVEVRGVQLKDMILACVNDINTSHVYFITKSGEKVNISEGTIAQVARYCK